MTLAETDYPLLSLMWTMLVFFGWILFIWLLITVYMDLFRRHDIGGWGKTGWVVFTILLPLIGTFVYLVTQGRHMQERTREQLIDNQRQMDAYVRSVAASAPAGGSADEIARAKQLLDSGAITAEEYETLKRKALAGAHAATGPDSVVAGR